MQLHWRRLDDEDVFEKMAKYVVILIGLNLFGPYYSNFNTHKPLKNLLTEFNTI